MRIRASVHYDWLQLIEVSGPFLSTTVLNETFPDGLDGLDKRVKRDLSRFYSEWVEACEIHHPKLPELHSAWIQSVLRDGLEFRDGDLSAGAEWSVAGEGGLGKFSPDYVLKGMDSKPVMFIKVLPVSVKPEDRDTSDDWKDSVIEKMTRLCRAYEVRIGLVTNGEKWVVVNAATGGTLSGTATWYARLWFQEDTTLRAFLALLGYRRFVGAPKKRLPYLLDESLKHLEEVTDTLGKQVMTAVEVLMEGFDRADLDSGRTLLAGVSPATLYESALTVMMRLVFLLCAEERGLMLLGEKTYDDVYAVSTLRKKLEEESDKFGPQVLECRYDAWARLLGVFRFVYHGVSHQGLRFPAMGGSLFDPEKYPFLEGNPPPLPIDNRTVLLILESLQVLKHKDGAIPLSFRSLDVEQIGYIYEGLLEFTGARAEELLLGLKGDKNHQNPEISLAELESLRMDSEEKLIKYVADKTGRTAIAKEYATEPNLEYLPYLSKICRGDKSLEERILPFLNWLRTSEWGEPVVYHKGSFYVTEGRDRRSSGTHYTPKTLTEMIVKEALEPVVYDGPAKGASRAEWKLKSPDELLSLKICDPAMGSGAFLVQACRYLGDRLVESWAAAERDGKAIASNGTVTDFPPNDPMSEVLEDRLCEARRLVAERCLYGVDINPLAVELAKLSLWLVTISKGRPFGFLDHNLKSGDSLLGVSDIEQLAQFRMKPDPHGNLSLLSGTIRAKVAEALKEREEIREMRMRDITDVLLAETKNAKVETLLSDIRDYADYFIGEVLVAGKPTKKSAARLDAAAVEGEPLLGGDALKATILKKQTAANLAYDLPAGQTAPRRPFHWAIEFPEVLAQGGFNAIIGNPPFRGGLFITTDFGFAYTQYLKGTYVRGAATTDFCAYFDQRVHTLLAVHSTFGLVNTNSITDGDTRRASLEVLNLSGTVYSCIPSMEWPGNAALCVALVFYFRGTWRGRCTINGEEVNHITVNLTSEDYWSPHAIKTPATAYLGTTVYGKSFFLTDDQKEMLLTKEPKSNSLILPFLNGEDVMSLPEPHPQRSVLCFQGMTESQIETFYPVVYSYARECIYPERQKSSSKGRREKWWLYTSPAADLYEAIKGLSRVLVTCFTSKFTTFLFLPKEMVFSNAVVVVASDKGAMLATLQSCFHEMWVKSYSSTLETRQRYVLSDCFETFPFPDSFTPELDDMGERYDVLRRHIMTSRNIGLTALYNLFHDPSKNDLELEEMRKLQREIDEAVRDAYGWSDIDLGHGFHEVGYLPANDNVRYTISEPARIEILKRLSALNRQRWEEEEAAGLHKKKGGK